MKKISVLLSIAVLATGMLAGCSGTDNSASGDTGTSAAAETDSGQEEAGGSGKVSFGKDVEFEPMTVIENENYTVRVTELDAEKDTYTFTVEMENASADQTYTLYAGEMSVDGLIYDLNFGGLQIYPITSIGLCSEVAPGTAESGTIRIDTDVFQEIGVTDFTDIRITFRVQNDDNFEVEAEETVHIYPRGQENASVYSREAQETDVVLVDTAEIKLTAVGSETDEESGDYTYRLYLENKSDQPLVFELIENSLNGYMIDSYPYGLGGYYYQIPAGTSSYLPMQFDEEDLQTNGITEVEEIEFKFFLGTLDESGYPGEVLLEETYTVTPAAQ